MKEHKKKPNLFNLDAEGQFACGEQVADLESFKSKQFSRNDRITL